MYLTFFSSRVRIYSYQASSPTELELKIKRELMSLEHQISDLLQNYQKECKKSESEPKYDRYFVYEKSETQQDDESENCSTEEDSENEDIPTSDSSVVQMRLRNSKDDFSDLDAKLRDTQKTIAEKSTEIFVAPNLTRKKYPQSKNIETEKQSISLFGKERQRTKKYPHIEMSLRQCKH